MDAGLAAIVATAVTAAASGAADPDGYGSADRDEEGIPCLLS